MRPTLSLYQCAEKHNIEVLSFPLPETHSMSIETEEGAHYIGMDYHRFDSQADERVHLSHELGHCITGAFYNRYAKMDVRQKHENRADRAAIQRYINKEELLYLLKHGTTQPWELADHFGFTEDFMKKAVCYYVHGNLATELYF